MSEVKVLDKEYQTYIGKLKANWLSQNRVCTRVVYEIMSDDERARVHQRINQWKRYITPLAEAWWKKRGYGVVWPDDDSKPMQVHKLETA